jgi:hypothetical protein
MADGMADAGLNCCSKPASTNVYKEFKCFNEHGKPAFVRVFVSTRFFYFLSNECAILLNFSIFFSNSLFVVPSIM